MTIKQSREWASLMSRSWEPRQWFDDGSRPECKGEDRIMWVYQGQSEKWAVGFYTPQGEWIETDTFDTKEEASRRVHYLNGGK